MNQIKSGTNIVNENTVDMNAVYRSLVTPYQKIYTDNNSGNSLYIGNQTTAGWQPYFCDEEIANTKKSLMNIGIKAIVCCADNIEIFPNDFKYLQIPMENNPVFPIRESLINAYNFISQNLLNGSVFIHCNAGVTRSASAVIFYDAIFLHRQIIVYYDNK